MYKHAIHKSSEQRVHNETGGNAKNKGNGEVEKEIRNTRTVGEYCYGPTKVGKEKYIAAGCCEKLLEHLSGP